MTSVLPQGLSAASLIAELSVRSLAATVVITLMTSLPSGFILRGKPRV